MEIPEGMKFFSPEAGTIGWNRLPHWDQQGRTYSLTFRLADSVPAHLLRKHRLEEADWREKHPEPRTPVLELEYHRRFTGAVEGWLEPGAAEGEAASRQHLCIPHPHRHHSQHRVQNLIEMPAEIVGEEA